LRKRFERHFLHRATHKVVEQRAVMHDLPAAGVYAVVRKTPAW
jgi:hypothetical protein